MKGKGGKDNASTIKLSRLTPRIKRPQRTLGSVTKLLEYFAPLKCGRIDGGICVCLCVEGPLDHSRDSLINFRFKEYVYRVIPGRIAGTLDGEIETLLNSASRIPVRFSAYRMTSFLEKR